ncbi:MAG: hypothetical protein P8X73_17385 [Ignavibacteriaceae bacterium]
MAKYIMIIVLGGMFTFGLKNITLNRTLNQGTQNSVDKFSLMRAQTVAGSMTDILLMRIANDKTYRVSAPETEDLFDGEVTYSVEDTYFNGDSLIKIMVSSNYNDVVKSVTAYTKTMEFSGDTLPPSVKAAITTNNPVATNGTIVVDGRDHDLSGALIPNKGKAGIWSISTIDQSGNSKIGGTESSIDYAPAKPGKPEIIKENQIWPTGILDTPDKVMGGKDAGYPENTLKNAAITGFGGSQYVTDPADLIYPLKGITYVELPSGVDWFPARLDGEGILIVHNSHADALIKNTDTGYVFKGFIIVDDFVHIHSIIIGSVFVLTESPSSGNVIGNGTGKVLYSRQALVKAIVEVEEQIKTQYGFAKKRLKVMHWYE